jgi:hypothetical protein
MIHRTAPDSRRYRRRGLSQRYSVEERTVDRMVRDGRLPPPDFYLGNMPIWTGETLDEHDCAAALQPRSKATA